jgi:hypothetical protein
MVLKLEQLNEVSRSIVVLFGIVNKEQYFVNSITLWLTSF